MRSTDQFAEFPYVTTLYCAKCVPYALILGNDMLAAAIQQITKQFLLFFERLHVQVTQGRDLRFSFCYAHKHFNVVVEHLASGRIDVSDLITARVGFAQFPDTFEHLKQPGHDLKVLLEPH